MNKYFWIKDFDNSYRIISKNIERKLYSCVKTGISSDFMNEKNFISEISKPILFSDIYKQNNIEAIYSIIEEINFNNNVFKDILKDIFIDKLSYDDISLKHGKCKPSISRIVKKIKNSYKCSECGSIHFIKPTGILTEGFYWSLVDNEAKIVLLEKHSNKIIAKPFHLPKGIFYDINDFKKNILFKIDAPIDDKDLKTEDGVERKIKRIENNSRTYSHSVKNAVKERVLSGVKLLDLSKKYDINMSSISRLESKVSQNTCLSCSQLY